MYSTSNDLFPGKPFHLITTECTSVYYQEKDMNEPFYTTAKPVDETTLLVVAAK